MNGWIGLSWLADALWVTHDDGLFELVLDGHLPTVTNSLMAVKFLNYDF